MVQAAPEAAPTAHQKLDPEGWPPSAFGFLPIVEAGRDGILACRSYGLVEEVPHQGMELQEQVSRLWHIREGEEIKINTEAPQTQIP